jgi:hypothetical protein
LLLAATATVAIPQRAYIPPAASAGEVSGIDFKASQVLAPLQERFSTCDRTDICDGKKLEKPYKCSSDPSPEHRHFETQGRHSLL